MTINVRKSFHFRPSAPWRKACWLAAAAGLPVIMLMLLPAEWQQLLRYERSAVVQHGEWWRLPASQWLHLGWSHALLNAAGWLLLCLLLVPTIGAWRTVALLGAAVAGTATGLLLQPQLGWYVGLSGALHGVLAGGMLLCWRQQAGLAAVVLALLAAKLLAEQLLGLSGGALPAGIRVVTEAHLAGAAGGLAGGIVLVLFRRRGRCV